MRAVLRFLVSIKNLGQCKKFPSDKFVVKKEHFVVCEMFLELQCLVDYLFIFFTLNILFGKVDRRFAIDKKDRTF